VPKRFRGNAPDRGQRAVGLLALSCLAVALPVLPAAALGQAPLRDSASGFGHVLQTDFIGAGEAGPNGEDPVGSLTLTGFLTFTTRTTCLNVSGNAVVSGGRILTGRDAGRGFLNSSIDHGPPVGGKPVDVTIFSGLLSRPPRNCPSPGDAPPERLRHTGGGPFTSGDLMVVDAIERLPRGAPAARVRTLDLGPTRPGAGLVTVRNGPTIRVRVCGGAWDGPGAGDAANEPAGPRHTDVGARELAGRAPPGRALPDPPDQLAGHRLRHRAQPHHGAGADDGTTLEPRGSSGVRSGLSPRSPEVAQRRCDIPSKKAATMANAPRNPGRTATPGRPRRASALESPPRNRAT
jgi:hypothetical protein